MMALFETDYNQIPGHPTTKIKKISHQTSHTENFIKNSAELAAKVWTEIISEAKFMNLEIMFKSKKPR